jgi:hypothetical protein
VVLLLLLLAVGRGDDELRARETPTSWHDAPNRAAVFTGLHVHLDLCDRINPTYKTRNINTSERPRYFTSRDTLWTLIFICHGC